MKTALLRSVSHDLRTPLTAIMTAAAALDPAAPDAEQVAEVRAVVLEAATRLAALVEKLLDLSRLQSGSAEQRIGAYSLEEVLGEAIEHVDGDHELLRLSLDDDLPLLEGDAGQLERAFANLLENAVRYSQGKPVSIRARVVGERVRVRIVDQGPGIRAGELERIFMPFYRSPGPAVLPPGLRSRPGDRQGLHRGQRRADLGRVAAGPGNELHRRVPAEQRRPARAGRDGLMAGERILVCDDDPQILRALRLVLRGAGYEVLTSATAEEALDRAAIAGPHAAIIDLMLPDRPGIEVCGELRSWSEMPIIVLSAVTDEESKIAALQNGADDYVTKPFAPGELVARVQAVLRRAGRAATEPRIEADGLVVDLAAHAVTLDGEEVRLTPIEFALLRALALNRGLLMTHRKLPDRGLGPGIRRRDAAAAHAYREPSPQAPGRRRAAALHPHRLRDRLPLHGLTQHAHAVTASRQRYR